MCQHIPERNHWSGHSRWLTGLLLWSSSHIQENDENKLCVLDLLTPDTRWIWEPYKYWYPEKDFYVISSSEHPPTAHCWSNIVVSHPSFNSARVWTKCQTLNSASTWYYTCSVATCLLLLLSCELYLIQSPIRHLPHSWLRRVCLRVGPGMCGALPLRLKAQSSPRRCARTRAGCFYSAHSLRTNQWAQALRASSSARNTSLLCPLSCLVFGLQPLSAQREIERDDKDVSEIIKYCWINSSDKNVNYTVSSLHIGYWSITKAFGFIVWREILVWLMCTFNFHLL